MTGHFAEPGKPAVPVFVLEQSTLQNWLETQPVESRNWVKSQGFEAKLGQVVYVPGNDGTAASALIGYGTAASRSRTRFRLAAGFSKLSAGVYSITEAPEDAQAQAELLGCLLTAYSFDTYVNRNVQGPKLVAVDGYDVDTLNALATGEMLARDLINTPANHMGPSELEDATRALAQEHKAAVTVITGDALIDKNFPLIHAVGRAADRAPRLIDLTWGSSGPKITLVGKGVCFDTGGLNLKPGGSMGLMKKDMGGAANVLGLAHMLMATKQKIRLRVLIPAVENAVSGNAFRPGDVLTSRKGLTVEINNTDAEGRLVLADALTFAQEDKPDLTVSMATLTGAARVALGPDLAPYYCDDQAFVSALETAAKVEQDPVWRMPFHEPYEAMIEPGIADLDNAPKGGFAGSITAALFLRRFVEAGPYAHFDIYGWNPTEAPARSKGGAGQGIRALFEVVRRYRPS
ncbi:MAG: leucyl aminopeptidase family protein [Pseudomonadota bacterium]